MVLMSEMRERVKGYAQGGKNECSVLNTSGLRSYDKL